MPISELLEVARGSVTAPAGCGKTHLIAELLKHQAHGKPALVLTHTNAGRAALESRMKKAGVPAGAARIATIDSWTIGIARAFPMRCGLQPHILNVENPRTAYLEIRRTVSAVLGAGHFRDIISATYSRLLVDEYQDCGQEQHAIVCSLANVLKALVFGDPLQAIFRFSGPVVQWSDHVHAYFAPAADLDTPWRWTNAGTEPLGRWLLSIRPALIARQPIDLRTAPAEVTWIQLTGDAANAHRQRMAAAQTRADRDASVLIIADSMNPAGQRRVASVTPGATTVEAVDLRDLTAFGRTFNPHAVDAVTTLVEFAAEMMTNLSQAQLLARIRSHLAGTSRTPPTELEHAVLHFAGAPSFGAAAVALRQLADGPSVRVYRPDTFRPCVSAMEAAHRGGTSFYDAVVRARERSRHVSRTVRGRSVGSTLLLKGLEADVCVVLYPEMMDGPNLYVALTRGARRLVVCSPSPIITPAATA